MQECRGRPYYTNRAPLVNLIHHLFGTPIDDYSQSVTNRPMTDLTNTISFRKAGPDDGPTLLAWLDEPHVREFWDLSAAGRATMLNYLGGAKDIFDYWVGAIGGARFCLVMTTDARDGEPRHLTPHIAPNGETWTVDFMIGDPDHVGRGLAAPALAAFAGFAKTVEPRLASLLIDPMASNTRAIHVYEKAGYEKVAEFTPPHGPFAGENHILMSLDLRRIK